MKVVGILFVGFLLLSSVVYAETKEDIAKCAAIESDAARLICFDNLAKSLGVDKPEITVSTGKGQWRVSEERSPIDDSVNVYLSVQSNEEVRSGYITVRPSLWIRCKENKTNVFIVWSLYLGLDETNLLVRFDKEKAYTQTWSISTDSKAVFVMGGDIGFVKKLMQHKKLLTQITPHGENPVMATFDISGLEEAIKSLRKACNW